jgi:homoaconitase/3-isopropylmalate dehydratase large subunit
MRARAGDPPRTMAQKILAGRCHDPLLFGENVLVKVDQVVLARSPARAFAEGVSAGLKKTTVEVAIAYDQICVTDADLDPVHLPEMAAAGLALGRAGAGYPSAVHLERYASPARLCVTDEPRLAGVGGVGMLTLVMPPGLLGQALAQGSVWVRPPRSIQVLLTGKMRPFVCARDVALELVRRGIGEAVRKVEQSCHAPVVLEFAGPSARLLSVAERSVLCALAPQLGAAAAIFVGDERTEVYLRDQRRSKAHRALVADPGAPCDDVVTIDLSGVDPLVFDDQVRAVRDVGKKPVAQVVLGGDSGVTLRDLFAVATLLKSKRVPPGLDFLVPVPSRQMLEVLASSGALADLVATGARIVEPDGRIMTGELYPPPPASAGVSLRTHDREPHGAAPFIVASAETIAWAVASGEVGDPRSFKRPVRVTVPRTLPTDDVLVVRDRKALEIAKRASTSPNEFQSQGAPYKGGNAEIIDAPAAAALNGQSNGKSFAVVCSSLDEVRQIAVRAPELAHAVRAVLAAFIPSGLVAVFSGVGIAAIQLDPATAKGLNGTTIALPPPQQWDDTQPTSVQLGSARVPMRWLALGAERAWASAGTARPVRKA